MRNRVRERSHNIPELRAWERFRQIPKSFHARAWREQNLPAPADHEQSSGEPLRRGLVRLTRDLALRSGRASPTLWGQRTFCAMRFPWQAHQRSQFHDCLIPTGWIALVQQTVRQRLHVGAAIVHQARDHPPHVAIHDGVRQTEGDARDRRGGVVADAGQFENCVMRRGKAPAASICRAAFCKLRARE